jgi:hypothetical protein
LSTNCKYPRVVCCGFNPEQTAEVQIANILKQKLAHDPATLEAVLQLLHQNRFEREQERTNRLIVESPSAMSETETTGTTESETAETTKSEMTTESETPHDQGPTRKGPCVEESSPSVLATASVSPSLEASTVPKGPPFFDRDYRTEMTAIGRDRTKNATGKAMTKLVLCQAVVDRVSEQEQNGKPMTDKTVDAGERRFA